MRFLRIFQAFIVVVLLALFLPKFIDSIFAKSDVKVNLYYSEILDKFIIQSGQNYQILGDKNITKDEFIANLPFKFYSYLLAKGIFPECFSEFANEDKIRANSLNFMIKPDIYNQKPLEIWTIFESNPPYLKLSFNDYALRAKKDSLEFVNLFSLKIEKELSAIYTNALKNSGFSFPIKHFFTNPTTKKPFDEGAFIVDSLNQIYHLKMIDGKPSVKKTDIKDGDLVIVSENTKKEFYAAILSKNSVKLISYDDYKLIELPSGDYDPSTDKFALYITPISKSVVIHKKDKILGYRLDDDYAINSAFQYDILRETTAKDIKEMILPFEIRNLSSYLYGFKFEGVYVKALILNLILCCLSTLLYGRSELIRHIFVLIFGIYGFIAMIFMAP